jgi:hypothetical protein
MSKKIGELLFSPSQVAEWFDVSRPTLFRWEKEGLLEKPDRGPRGERIYHRYHLVKISNLVKQRMRTDLGRTSEESTDNPIPSIETLERLYKMELFCSDNPEHGLEQLRGLAASNGLNQSTCNTLINEIQVRPRGDVTRTEILKILLLDSKAGE